MTSVRRDAAMVHAQDVPGERLCLAAKLKHGNRWRDRTANRNEHSLALDVSRNADQAMSGIFHMAELEEKLWHTYAIQYLVAHSVSPCRLKMARKHNTTLATTKEKSDSIPEKSILHRIVFHSGTTPVDLRGRNGDTLNTNLWRAA